MALMTTPTRVCCWHSVHMRISSQSFSSPGYQAGFAKLTSSGRPDHDPFPEATNAKAFVATSLHQLSSHMPGQAGVTLL